MQSKTDKELLDRFVASGDGSAFAELVARYSPMVYRACRRLLSNDHDAEDATQAAFVVLARKAGSLRQEGRLNGWLHRVARLVALEALRKRMKHERNQMESALWQESLASDASESDRETVLRQVDTALDGLSTVLREAVVLRYLRGLSEKEAAVQAGCPVSAMKWRASDGIAKLRQRLAKRGVALGGVALTGLLTSEASAVVPETLLPSILATVKTAVATTATATGATTTAAMLAKGAMKVMFIAKVKTAALVTAASLVVAGGGTIVAQEVAAQRKAAEQPATEVQAAVPANLATNGVEDIALPDTAEALFRYGQQMEKQGKIAIACRAYKTFFERYPDHSQIHEVGYCLGRCLYASGDADKAIKTLEEATRIRNANFRNRPEALFFLSRLYGDTGDYDKACKTLETLLGEGAGLYEEAALNMCGHYYAKLQKYDEAAAKYSVLERRTNSPYAKDAAYGLAMVRLMAEKLDLARNAIDSFAQRYPGNARIAELSMRMARVYYAKKQLKNAMDICQQILTGFKDAPEAIEAAFLIAIIHRDSEQFEQAADCLLRIAHMPQATNNAALVAEAIFENAQIFRQQLKQPDKAADRYHEAATRSRDPVTERQRSILEQSLFYEAEFRFQQQKWGAAFDLYDQLRKLGSKLNVEERMLYCKSKMNAVEKAVGRETETGKQGTGNL